MAKARTSFLAEGIAGRVGNVVYVRGPNGTTLRARPGPRVGAVSEAEREGQRLTALVATHWSRLDPDAMGRWRAYAQALTAARPAGSRTATSGYNEFFALSKKLLQIDPTGDVPTKPPTGRFVGDLPQFAVEATGEGEETGVGFVASRANEPGVRMECLLQRLANGGRLPTARGYRSQGFVAFGEGLGAAFPVPPGWYAGATRFVEAATGRATDVVPCGVMRVG